MSIPAMQLYLVQSNIGHLMGINGKGGFLSSETKEWKGNETSNFVSWKGNFQIS